MKKTVWTILLLLLVNSCFKEEQKSLKHDHAKAEKEVKTYYTCSMHPQVREDKPGKCPICGMGLTKVEEVLDEEHASHSHSIQLYSCEADPSITSEAPGECPIDGSPMVEVKKEQSVVAKVSLRKSQVNHFKADLFEVTPMMMQKKIRLLGTVLKSENKESNIPARIPGRVEEVIVQSTGSFIKKGDPVLKLYSPKLLTGADEYLIARKNYFSNRRNKEFKELYEQSIQRMKLWGVLDDQLENWANEKKVPREITIYSPVTGIVEQKNAIKGKYFKEGQSFFDLVDLDTLWVEMDVYEHDSALVKTGQEVEFEFSAYPGELWRGKIDFISPVLDRKTRTLKIRTTLDNSDGKLRPGMVGTASVNLKLAGTPLVIPRTAVIDTGKRKVVWIDLGKNKYQAKRVRTGFESEGYVEVKEGLAEGDQVIVDGNFLLDAQAQLFGGYDDSKTN